VDVALVALAACLGLAFGSFANVLIHRVPRGESVVNPPSACPACSQPVRRRHNVPVVSWLWLRGKCADCGTRISPRYPLVELSVGVVFALITALVSDPWILPLLLVLGYCGIVLSAIDFEHHRLPDRIVAPFAVATVVSIGIALQGPSTGADAWRALMGAGALGAFYFLIFVIYPAGMGWGDVKVAPVIGATLGVFGWPQVVVGGFSAFLWGSLIGIGVLILKKGNRKTGIPFGPWMFVGAWTGIIAGPTLGHWYVNDLLGL
jgi:leader peptidase (prepilin peptidase)/N-methyltransferase